MMENEYEPTCIGCQESEDEIQSLQAEVKALKDRLESQLLQQVKTHKDDLFSRGEVIMLIKTISTLQTPNTPSEEGEA